MDALAAGMNPGLIALKTHHDVECVGPLEEYRERYINLRDRLKAMMDSGDGVRSAIAAVRRQLEAIPMERKWLSTIDNIVVTEGLNDSLDKHFKGSGYTAAWFVGLTDDSPNFVAGDTMSSHGGWIEIHTQYSEPTRPVLTLGSVSGGSVNNSASKAVFSITGSTTVGGAFVVANNTKNGTTGPLYGGGPFTENDRLVANGDTINSTITLTAAAAP